MPYCTRCGHQNPEGSNFCGQCGQPLAKPEQQAATEATQSDTKQIPVVVDEVTTGVTELSADEEAAVASLPAGHALLIVLRGPSAGARFLLDGEETVAGRHPDSDIFLDDITVSRHHVRFARTETGMTVSDVGSLNGTYVNRTLIDGEVPLKQGDEVQIGKFRMVYFASSHGLG
ncbi:FHA domain-containing protein [Mariniluteicoccus flavus]